MERMTRSPVVSGVKGKPLRAHQGIDDPEPAGAGQSGESQGHNQLASPWRLPDKPMRVS